jgi:UDP-glucose 4-epimerase
MEVLVVGNTAYVDDDFCAKAFPGDHVKVVAAAEGHRDESSPHASWNELLQHLEQAYEFDRVVYLSNFLTPHTDTVGDIELLRSVFRACMGRRVQLLYVAGPAGAEGAVDAAGRTGKGIIARAANDLCRHYAAHEGVQAKILRVPFLYTASAALEDPFFAPLFDACLTGSVALQGSEDAAFPLLCAEELAVLVRRIFDSWDASFETLDVADTFHHTSGEVGEALKAMFPGLVVAYGDSAGYALPVSDIVRVRYGWFQRYDLLRDLSTIQARWDAGRAGKVNPLRAAIDRIQMHTLPIKCLETGVAWILFEVLDHLFSQSAQLNVLDYRLLYVVLIGTLYGLDFGLFAALLASVGLAVSFFTQYGYTFQGLFYEPSNWLPFIAYFVVGAVCGYVQLRNSEAIKVERGQNELVRNRNTFLTQLYHDAIEDKRTYKRQIVGRHDSFGKIFAVTQELDVLNPRDIYRKCCELMGEILENDSVAIYHVSGGTFARLVAASPVIAEDATRSLSLEQLLPLLGGEGRSNLWVNRKLTPGLPMFGYTIERDGAPAVLIFVRRAAENQMTLYYQNLFRILCGLVESALGRAFDYEAVAQDKRCVDGTCVLKQEAFGQELAAEQALADGKMGSFLLLRVVPGMEPVGELVGAIGSAIRESDAAGLVDGDVLYLLMRQAKACDLPIIRKRLSAKQIAVELVDGEDIVALLQHIAGDGEGDVV